MKLQNNTSSDLSGFTLMEVVISLVLVALMVGGIVYGYTMAANRAEWASYSLAAQSLAMQGLEQMRASTWRRTNFGIDDQLTTDNFSTNGYPQELDLLQSGTKVYATNYFYITTVSTDPPVKSLRVDCVWNFRGRRDFTNSIMTYRAPDQPL
jgi:Tfp pilus assembly protein PilV